MNKLTQNTKTAKAPKEWENYILHLSPMNRAFKVLDSHYKRVQKLVLKRLRRKNFLSLDEVNLIRKFNSCPWAGACGKYCLDTSGRGKFSNVQIARAAKTIHKILDSDGFDLELVGEIERKAIKARKEGKKIAIRLNGTSDLEWVAMIIQHFTKSYKARNGAIVPMVQFYDYTKDKKRFGQWMDGQLPENYHLTYSYDRKNNKPKDDIVLEWILSQSNGKIAIMSGDYEALKTQNKGVDNLPTIDGDNHDLRFFDRKIKGPGFVILKEKGDAKKQLINEGKS